MSKLQAPRGVRKKKCGTEIESHFQVHPHQTLGRPAEPRAVLYNDEIKRSEIMKTSGKRTDPRKATQRFAEKTKPRATTIDGRRKRAVKSGMSAEMSSLEENAEKFARYAGQWLLLAEGKLITHSRNYSAVAREITRRGLKDGLVYYVRSRKSLISYSSKESLAKPEHSIRRLVTLRSTRWTKRSRTIP